MPRDPQQTSQLYTQIDITAGAQGEAGAKNQGTVREQTELLHQLLAAVDRSNELLEELVTNATSAQRQRTEELRQWRRANPALADGCKRAAEALARVQAEFLDTLTHEIQDNAEAMQDGEFVFNEFVDRFGPRLAHLNGVLQMLSQLSNAPESAENE